MRLVRPNLLHSAIASSVLATGALIADLQLRADTDVPWSIRTIECIAGAIGQLLSVAAWHNPRIRQAWPAATVILTGLLSLYCVAHATVLPRVNHN